MRQYQSSWTVGRFLTKEGAGAGQKRGICGSTLVVFWAGIDANENFNDVVAQIKASSKAGCSVGRVTRGTAVMRTVRLFNMFSEEGYATCAPVLKVRRNHILDR
jgi:hypothetical protein